MWADLHFNLKLELSLNFVEMFEPYTDFFIDILTFWLASFSPPALRQEKTGQDVPPWALKQQGKCRERTAFAELN